MRSELAWPLRRGTADASPGSQPPKTNPFRDEPSGRDRKKTKPVAWSSGSRPKKNASGCVPAGSRPQENACKSATPAVSTARRRFGKRFEPSRDPIDDALGIVFFGSSRRENGIENEDVCDRLRRRRMTLPRRAGERQRTQPACPALPEATPGEALHQGVLNPPLGGRPSEAEVQCAKAPAEKLLSRVRPPRRRSTWRPSRRRYPRRLCPRQGSCRPCLAR
jgi:hypothetical protein